MDPRPGRPRDQRPGKFFAGLRDALIEFAEHEFTLEALQPDGHSLRTHLEAIQQATGQRPEQLDGPECPRGCAYVWMWFCELNAARGSNGFGMNPIGYVDIEAWARLTGRAPNAFEVGVLLGLDVKLRVMRAEEAERARK